MGRTTRVNQSEQTCWVFSTNQKQDQNQSGFAALGAGYMFSRAWHWLHVFPRLTLVACFVLSSDWFVALFAFVVIGHSVITYFDFVSPAPPTAWNKNELVTFIFRKRHSKTAGSETSGGPEEGELVPTKKKSRRTREPKEPKNENAEPREEGQRTPTPWSRVRHVERGIVSLENFIVTLDSFVGVGAWMFARLCHFISSAYEVMHEQGIKTFVLSRWKSFPRSAVSTICLTWVNIGLYSRALKF